MNKLSLFKGRWYYYIIMICFYSSNCLAYKSVGSIEDFSLYFNTETKQQQQSKITGKVTFENMPINGVTISVKGKTIVTISDENGSYSINADVADTLIFTYSGFQTLEINVNGRKTINAVMQEDLTALKEVTVNTGYYSVKESEFTGSIASINAKTIEQQPALTNILATMQGRMAGVNVVQETGVPGGGFAITIRGLNSLRSGGNAPLYIIDGVPYSSEPISNAQTSTSIPGDGNPLGSINPGDIENLEILKDADATSIYGSRGANGVVLITTKKGKSGKTNFTVNTNYGVGAVTNRTKLMNTPQYLDMREQGFANDGVTTFPASAYDVNGTWDRSRYTDWQEELIGGTAEILSVQASVAGGTGQTRFLFSGNYRTESTVFPGNSLYKKGGARLSLDHKSEDKRFGISFSAGYTAQNNDLPWTDFVNLATTLAPNAPALYDEQGNLNWENGTWQNPLVNLYAENKTATYDLIASTLLSYQLAPSLEIRSSFGFSDLHNKDSRTSPSTMYNPTYNRGPQYSSIYKNQVARQSWIVEPQLNWHGNYGNSKVDVLFGGTFQNQVSDRLVHTASGFTSNSLLYNLKGATYLTIEADEKNEYKYQAFYGRTNYMYAGKYIVNFTGRRDGSSRFGAGKQFATFGAVGAAWLFHKETFLGDGNVLSFGKLRSSYGTTGNDQIGDYQFLDTYATSGYEYQGIKGLKPMRLYNAEFGWETNKKLEVALELGFFDDRILMTSAWYRNRSSNQLVGYPLPATTGFTSIQSNLDATVQNSGLELTLRTVNVKTQDFNWTMDLNLTLPKSKLISFPGLESSAYKNAYVVGEPITIVKQFHYTGTNPETGLYEYEDYNGDGLITYQDDFRAVSDLGPKFYGGLQNQFTYKGFQLDFLFQFVKQNNYNYAATQNYAGTFRNQPTAYLNHWEQKGDITTHQQFTSGQNSAAMLANDIYGLSDATVDDASYVRLKSLYLSYDFPRTWAKGLGFRLFIQGQNLLTITEYKGADPEFTLAGTLPPLKVWSVGLQFTF